MATQGLTVHVERRGQGFAVTVECPTAAVMARVTDEITRINPAGFVPAPPVVPHNVAAEILRDRVLASDDDTREPPRCATGACDGE
jgi:hypothetical protein